jgi:hypothetical protein
MIVDSNFYAPKLLLLAALGNLHDSAINPAYDVALKNLRKEAGSSELAFKCKFPFPHPVQEQPLDITPIQSKDGHFLLVPLFQEPLDNYAEHSKKKFKKI